ncbi:MAG: hypothetical protein WHV63_07890 [Ignavibacteria bacterium]
MTKQILADRIKQLINISQTLLDYCTKFKELNYKYFPNLKQLNYLDFNFKFSILLRFLQNMFYYDALLNLNTILALHQKDQNKKELSIFELIELETDTNLKEKLKIEAEELRNKLESKNLHKWRNKYVAHKDLINAGDPEIMYLNFIKDEYIACTSELLQEADKFLSKYYDIAFNNTFNDLYENSFNWLIELLEKNLKAYCQQIINENSK